MHIHKRPHPHPRARLNPQWLAPYTIQNTHKTNRKLLHTWSWCESNFQPTRQECKERTKKSLYFLYGYSILYSTFRYYMVNTYDLHTSILSKKFSTLNRTAQILLFGFHVYVRIMCACLYLLFNTKNTDRHIYTINITYNFAASNEAREKSNNVSISIHTDKIASPS